MRLTPFDRNDMKRYHGRYKGTENQMLIEEFMKSDLDCAKIEGWKHTSAKACQNSLWHTIKSLNMQNSVRCKIRGEAVFLVRIDKE